MKVIFFVRYGRTGASSRLRTFQYLDFLTENGIDCKVSSFFDDQYLRELYESKKHNKWRALRSLVKRCLALLSVFRYDQVVIEKELIPFFPAIFEWCLRLVRIRYIVDYDDAVYHNYDLHPNRVVRWLLGQKISHVMKYAGLVVAGNEYIRQKAVDSGAGKVVIVPTVVDMARYKSADVINKVFTIGWVGSPVTSKYLPFLKPVIDELATEFEIRLVLIGAGQPLGLTRAKEVVKPWVESTEVTEIQQFDVGIMPLENSAWEQGKCGYKLIQYLGCGVPVIGTPVGVNNIIIRDENGFKAESPEAWSRSIRYLIENPARRREMGEKGRAMVTVEYSLQVYQKVWLELLRNKY